MAGKVKTGKLSVGDSAPKFSLPDADGKMHSLSDFAKKTLVVYFYPRDDTPGCTVEACDFRDHAIEFAKLGAAIVGISADDAKSHAKFSAKHKLNFPLLSDAGHSVCEKYGVWEKKKFMGREFMGIVRSTFVIDGKGKIKSALYGVNPLGHAKQVIGLVENSP